MSDLFYIQNDLACVGNEAVWWREGGHGYTSHLSEAGKLTKADADCLHANRRTDVPWPCAEIEALAYLAVDVGDLRRRLRERDLAGKLGLVEGALGSVGEAAPEKDLSEDLPAALPECLFQYCSTLDKCRADGCRHPRPERSDSKTVPENCPRCHGTGTVGLPSGWVTRVGFETMPCPECAASSVIAPVLGEPEND